jgi:hypothetical protein
MNDLYTEHLVKCKPTVLNKALRVLSILVTVLIAVGILIYPILIYALLFAILVEVNCFKYFNWEYEYIFVDGQIDIDRIMGQNRRKRMNTFDLDETEIVAPADSHEMDSYRHKEMKEYNYTSNNPDAKVYVMVTKLKDNMVKVKFEPNEKMLEMMKLIAPRKVITD